MSTARPEKKRRPGRLRLPNPRSLAAVGRLPLLVGTAFIVCLAYLMGMNRTLELAAGLEDLQTRCEAAERQVERLELEVSALLESDRVVTLARERLGMEFPAGGTRVLAVAPEAHSRDGDFTTYLKNAFAITLEGLQHQLLPTARAREVSPPDSVRGRLP